MSKRTLLFVATVAVISVVVSGFVVHELSKHDVSAEIDGAGTVQGIGKYHAGKVTWLRAVPNYGWRFSHWEYGGETHRGADTLPVGVTAGNTTVKAFFERIDFTINSRPCNPYMGTVSGGGTVPYGDSVELTATALNDYVFKGWSIDGAIVSVDAVWKHVVQADAEVVAVFGILADAGFVVSATGDMAPATITCASLYDAFVSHRKWEVRDALSEELLAESEEGAVYSFFSESYGKFSITQTVTYENGQTDSKTLETVLDGYKSLNVEWEYPSTYERLCFLMTDIKTARVNTWLRFSHFLEDLERDLPRGYAFDRVGEFVRLEDPYVKQIADYINGLESSPLNRLNCALKFVQAVGYVSDFSAYGVCEYWKQPLETLYDMYGDCEDTTFLYASIVEEMGYDAVLFHMPGHIAVGVHADGLSGHFFTRWGKDYYYCETTEVGAFVPGCPNNVGDLPYFNTPFICQVYQVGPNT